MHSRGPYLRTFTLVYDCGVIDLDLTYWPPPIGGPARAHVCAWQARGITCTVKSWSESKPPTKGSEPRNPGVYSRAPRRGRKRGPDL